jgi:hypothetical protein
VRAVVLYFAAAITLGACHGGDAPDGGPDAAPDVGDDAGLPVMAPMIPWLGELAPPVMLPVEPYPVSGREACGPGQAHFPGESGCAPVGAACPSGEYANALPADTPIIYVDDDAAPGGDGSLAAPYAALSDVDFRATGGAVVALAKGSYAGPIAADAGTLIVGACAPETRLTGVAGPIMQVVAVNDPGAPVTLRNLAIVDAPQMAVYVSAGRSAVLEGVWISGATDAGILVEGADASVTARDLVIAGSRPVAGMFGTGVVALAGARFEAAGLIVADNLDAGLAAVGSQTTVSLTDAAIVDTRGTVAGADGRGIAVQDGASFTATRVLVEGNHSFGVFATDTGTTVTLTESIVRATDPQVEDGLFGRGLDVESGATLEASRVVVADNHDIGIFVAGLTSTATLADAVISGTRSLPDEPSAGMLVQQAGSLTATNLVVEDNQDTGIAVIASGARARLDDVVVRRTGEREDGLSGRGVDVEESARLEASRLLVHDNLDLGIFANGSDTVVVLEDSVVRGVGPQPGDMSGGIAVSAQRGARVTATRLHVEDAREAGVLAIGATIEGTDVTVDRIARSACDGCGRPDGYAAVGVSGQLSLSRFALRDAETCGLFIAAARDDRPPDVDLTTGLVERAAIGACVQVEGYDLGRLTDDVHYRDNVSNLDVTMLPVPGESPPAMFP